MLGFKNIDRGRKLYCLARALKPPFLPSFLSAPSSSLVRPSDVPLQSKLTAASHTLSSAGEFAQCLQIPKNSTSDFSRENTNYTSANIRP